IVKSLTSYGAFVDIGGVDGMVHISEMSWKRIKHPSEIFTVGQEVEVFIKSLDRENKKISLGYRKDEDNPWAILAKNYPVDTVIDAEIVGLTDFGAFAKVIPGIDGLIHISQIANHRVNKPADELEVGQTVTCKITAIDYDKKRVSLSIRALLEPEEEEAADDKAVEEDEALAEEAAPAEEPQADEAPVEDSAE
ncbi:MAG: S1 RNA-binding domain-containing protein, partial [Clostridia bacterium]|nr:S1 RNA-binding domain-containing protein [Clostridia bacterium]